MKIFITGGSGRLGFYLCRKAAAQGWDVWAGCLTHRPSLEGVQFLCLDISDERAVHQALSGIGPSMIIHTAAITYETDRELLFRVNCRGTENLLAYCSKSGAYMAYISTDLVFDGRKGRYTEDDPVNPAGNYPESKLAGEAAVLESGIPSSILRVPINYGWTRGNSSFIEWILARVKAGEQVPLFTDQHRSPIYLGRLADAVLETARRSLTGILHLAGSDRITRYEFGLKAASAFGFARDQLRHVSMEDMDYSGSRCWDCSLDTGKARQLLETALPGVDEGLALLRAEKSPSASQEFSFRRRKPQG